MGCGRLNVWTHVKHLEQCVPRVSAKCLSLLLLSSSSFSCFSQFWNRRLASAISHFVVFYFSKVIVTGSLPMCLYVSLVSKPPGTNPNHLLQMQIPGPFPRLAELWLLEVGLGNERLIYFNGECLCSNSSGSTALRVPHILLLIKNPGWKMDRKEEYQPLN